MGWTHPCNEQLLSDRLLVVRKMGGPDQLSGSGIDNFGTHARHVGGIPLACVFCSCYNLVGITAYA